MFNGAKCWREKMVIWLTAMDVFHVAQGSSEEMCNPANDKAFVASNKLFPSSMINVLGGNLVDACHHFIAKICGILLRTSQGL